MSKITRGEQKSLAFHRAVAEKLRANPTLVNVARQRLDWYRQKNPAGKRYYDEWEKVLNGPLDELLDVLTSEAEASCALRQENPFVDIVPQRERSQIYRDVATAIDQLNRHETRSA